MLRHMARLSLAVLVIEDVENYFSVDFST